MDSIVYLSERARPQKELRYSTGLSKACRDHVLDIGTKGEFSHIGSDGSDPLSRAARYINSGEAGIENLSFIDERSGLNAVPESVVSTMIVSDGELDRDTRENVFSPDFTHVGVACGCHSVIGEVCCFAYGKDIDDGNITPESSLIDVPREQCNLERSSGGRIKSSPEIHHKMEGHPFSDLRFSSPGPYDPNNVKVKYGSSYDENGFPTGLSFQSSPAGGYDKLSREIAS